MELVIISTEITFIVSCIFCAIQSNEDIEVCNIKGRYVIDVLYGR